MAQLPTYRPAPGDVAAATQMNSLFTGVGTATASLNNDNVRSQGVDIGQIKTVTVGDAGRVTRFVGQYNDTSSINVNDSTTTTVAEWNMGAGAEFDIGHLARLYTTFEATAQTVGTAQYSSGAADVQATRIQRQQLFSGAGWVFWLEWDVTSTARANYVPVPGQEDFGNHLANITDLAGSAVPHMRTAQAASVMVVPHVYCSVDSSAGSNNGRVLKPINGQFSNPIRRSRAYHRQRTGTNTRIYGIRLRARGVCSIGVDPAGTGQGIFYVRDTVLFQGTGAGEWFDYSFNNEQITIANASFRLMVQVPQ